MLVTIKTRKGWKQDGSGMAYPNEIKQIMEIIQDAKESLAQRQVDQWLGWLSR